MRRLEKVQLFGVQARLGESLQLLLEKEASGQFWRCVSDGHPEVALPSWWPIAV